ncbi:MAG TPA: class I SAM-dependent methyltransferase [Mycobacteriales bacterium]|jgi:SAM-dependent methyltransferase|nr:class I SAM-dependent methyltransferase [Mycobacteriales bacterium]
MRPAVTTATSFDDDAADGDLAAYVMHKHRLLGALRGTVLEIGAGGGANFAWYRASIDWIGLEPSRVRRRQLAATAAAHGQHAPVLAAPVETIPLPDGRVDAVVGTVVLCSVADQARALAEIRRVLRPGGQFVFFEHVAAPAGTWSRRMQSGWAPISRRFDAGCDPTRETGKAIADAGFAAVRARRYSRRPAIGVYNPFIGGSAFR